MNMSWKDEMTKEVVKVRKAKKMESLKYAKVTLPKIKRKLVNNSKKGKLFCKVVMKKEYVGDVLKELVMENCMMHEYRNIPLTPYAVYLILYRGE